MLPTAQLPLIAFIIQTSIHILGHIADAGLFVYLVNCYFTPKKHDFVFRQPNIFVIVIFAFTLYLTDILSNYNFFPYVTVMILLPLLYSVFYFQGQLITKAVLCFVLTYLIISFEALIIHLRPRETDTAVAYLVLSLFLFFMQRIGVKLLLYFIIQKILLWPKEHNIELPVSYWILLFLLSLGGFLFDIIFAIPRLLPSYPQRILLTLYLSLIPVGLLFMIKYVSLAAEKNKTANAQIVQTRVQNQYLRQQIDMMDSLKKFRHDYKSQLFAMDTLLEAGKLEELHEYLLSLHQYQYDGIHLRHFVADESLNIILNQKASVAEKAGIRFHTDVVLPQKGKIDISDLNVLIINLCDNAIEACIPIQNAEISLTIHQTKDYLMIQCTNTCSHDVLKTNPHLHTTKRNPQMHGLGTRIIQEIIEKYDGQYHVSSTSNTFTSQMMLLDQ